MTETPPKKKKVPKRYQGHALTPLSKEEKRARRNRKRALRARITQAKRAGKELGFQDRVHEEDGN